MLRRARAYFRDQAVLEVDVPALHRYAASDPNIESLRVRSGDEADHFLQTSPESYMKRLLAAGYPDIYSICRVFRDGESGKRHLPEFTMAEWYRLRFDLDAIVDAVGGVVAEDIVPIRWAGERLHGNAIAEVSHGVVTDHVARAPQIDAPQPSRRTVEARRAPVVEKALGENDVE